MWLKLATLCPSVQILQGTLAHLSAVVWRLSACLDLGISYGCCCCCDIWYWCIEQRCRKSPDETTSGHSGAFLWSLDWNDLEILLERKWDADGSGRTQHMHKVSKGATLWTEKRNVLFSSQLIEIFTNLNENF